MTPIDLPAFLITTLRRARRVVVLTGAGISADSGLPTFRDPLTGLWAAYRPQDLATPDAFRRNPRLVWEWYQWRRALVLRAQPNAAHHALVTMERQVPTFTLLTQNVDGFHQDAGSTNVVELHGTIHRAKCVDHGHVLDQWPETTDLLPRCAICHSLVRPAVVWFGEDVPEPLVRQAEAAARACDLFFTIGTSNTVYPAAGLQKQAWQGGAIVVTINVRGTTHVATRHIGVAGRAAEILPALVAQTWPDAATSGAESSV